MWSAWVGGPYCATASDRTLKGSVFIARGLAKAPPVLVIQCGMNRVALLIVGSGHLLFGLPNHVCRKNLGWHVGKHNRIYRPPPVSASVMLSRSKMAAAPLRNPPIPWRNFN